MKVVFYTDVKNLEELVIELTQEELKSKEYWILSEDVNFVELKTTNNTYYIKNTSIKGYSYQGD